MCSRPLFEAAVLIAVATHGIHDSVLLRVLARDGTVPMGVGELVAPGTDAFCVTALKEEAEVAGDLWILLNRAAGEPSVILVFNDQGSQRQRVVIPGVAETGAFAVDAARGRLYVTTSEAGLLRCAVPHRCSGAERPRVPPLP